MNDSPPFGDATDEAVSALLDDELDDFAASHGTTSDDVTRRLAAWTGFEDRRRELEQARVAVATAAPTLDALDRRRLARVAADAATSACPLRRRAPWRAIATAAAAIVVIAAAGLGLSRLGGGSTSSSKASKSAGTAAGVPVEASAFVGNVGELSDAATVRSLLTRKQAGLPIHTQDEFEAESRAAAGQREQPTPSTSPGQRAAAEAADRAAARRCAETLDRPRAGAATDPVVLLAAATFRGRPAVVVGVRHGTRSVVFVAARDTCAVLTSQSL